MENMMVKENIPALMGMCMQGDGKMGKCMVKEHKLGKMKMLGCLRSSRESGKKGRSGTEYFTTQTEASW